MVFPSLYCSEVSSSLFEVSYALISGYALGRHKVNGGILDGWQLTLFAKNSYSTAFKIDSALESVLKLCAKVYSPTLLFVRLTVDYLMCSMLNRIQTLHPSAIRTSFPLNC